VTLQERSVVGFGTWFEGQQRALKFDFGGRGMQTIGNTENAAESRDVRRLMKQAGKLGEDAMKQTHGRTRSRRVIGNVKLILVLLSIFLPASFLAAQQVQEFTGRVTDPSGAVLAKAMVIAHNVDSGVDTSTTTTSTGNYTIPYLIPGHYSISATAPGFETGVRTGLTLQVDQAATVNFALKVGSTTETVTVNADSLLDAAKADNGVVIENTRVTELPLNGRNVGMLAVLAPGALFEGDSEYVKGGVKPDQWGGVKVDR
jgi:hypothetical protein